ncbi:hypothetical protein [Chitinimonas naiadis]
MLISLGSHAALLWFWPQWDNAGVTSPPHEHGAALARLQVRLLPLQTEKGAQHLEPPASSTQAAEARPARRVSARPRALIATGEARPADIVSRSTELPLESPAGPNLNVEALREQLRGDLRRQAPALGMAARQAAPPSAVRPRDAALAAAIEKTARPDCRNAYAEAGLLAVVPLLKDAVTGSGCKW